MTIAMEGWNTFILLTCTIGVITCNPYEAFEASLRSYPQPPAEYREGFPRNIPTQEIRDEYDFIVVGAGPGGATVTNRLTEVPGWSVLLLEAGREESKFTDVPLLVSHFQHTDYNWGYRSQPQSDACLGLKDRRCVWPRGKGMGGTSIINYMIYTRGHPRDYNNWAKAGNTGWNYEEVLKYFLKSENASPEYANSPFHSTGGYLDVQGIPYKSKLSRAFMDAGKEMGEPAIDYNAGKLLGFSPMQVTMRNGFRCSASKAFLRPIRNRENLHIAKEAQATRVLIDPTTKRAYGVEFQRYGRRYQVRVRKEVILSAGSIDSPKLLMLSGVGPRDHLESVNIPVVLDLPGVGNNLQEHVSMSGLTFLVNDTVGVVENRVLSTFDTVTEFVNKNNGPLTLPGGCEALGYIRTDAATTPKDYPDVELIFASGSLNSDDGRSVRKGLGVTDDFYNKVFAPINSQDAWTIWPMILQPESRGWVRLKNNNPLSWPLMYGNYFAEENDLKSLVEGIKYSVRLSKTEAFRRFGSVLHDIPYPGCTKLPYGSDDYWACAARQLTTTLHHQCGTCKMGPSSDPWAVVDPELKVHGIKGLRVVDASIIPRIPAAHTNAPSFMIGEKAADMIKRTWKKF